LIQSHGTQGGERQNASMFLMSVLRRIKDVLATLEPGASERKRYGLALETGDRHYRT